MSGPPCPPNSKAAGEPEVFCKVLHCDGPTYIREAQVPWPFQLLAQDVSLGVARPPLVLQIGMLPAGLSHFVVLPCVRAPQQGMG